jgi:hypothetical protein
VDPLEGRPVGDRLAVRIAVLEPPAAPAPPDPRVGVGRIDEPFLAQLGLVGDYFFFACALLMRAARSLLMPFFFRASYVSFFLIECIFLPGMSFERR